VDELSQSGGDLGLKELELEGYSEVGDPIK